MSVQVIPRKTVAILGGGITGLSTAYYLKKKYQNLINPIIIEKSSRLGGWIKTIQRGNEGDSDRIRYECGPRTVRPAGVGGMNTLDLLEEIGIDKQVVYVMRDHPSAKNRFLYLDGKLTKFPTDMSVLFKKKAPFQKPLIFAGLRDLITPRKRLEDDSIYNFVKRRFGQDIADYAIDPLLRGVCAGNSKELTVKFMMKQLFEHEQKYGSVVLGLLVTKWKERKSSGTTGNEEDQVGFSKIALTSLQEGWITWTLENGLQSLVDKLENILVTDNNVSIHKNCDIHSMQLSEGDAMIDYSSGEKDKRINTKLKCDHIISTIPAHALSTLMQPINSELSTGLETVKAIDVEVTNVMYNDDVIPSDYEGFGFLVPSLEKSVNGLLGVVFDTCCFPQGDKTILTVMSYPQANTEKAIKTYLESTLRISRAPDDFHTQTLLKCIPQYNLGHYERVATIRTLVKKEKLPLTMIGASFDGVSVNECIYSGKQFADTFGV